MFTGNCVNIFKLRAVTQDVNVPGHPLCHLHICVVSVVEKNQRVVAVTISNHSSSVVEGVTEELPKQVVTHSIRLLPWCSLYCGKCGFPFFFFFLNKTWALADLRSLHRIVSGSNGGEILGLGQN